MFFFNVVGLFFSYFLELFRTYEAKWALLWRFSTFVNITANYTSESLFHNVRF